MKDNLSSKNQEESGELSNGGPPVILLAKFAAKNPHTVALKTLLLIIPLKKKTKLVQLSDVLPVKLSCQFDWIWS